MSSPLIHQITVTAHQSHWYDLVTSILKATSAANPILAIFLPATIEAGIQIATQLGPLVTGVLSGHPLPVPPVPAPIDQPAQ